MRSVQDQLNDWQVTLNNLQRCQTDGGPTVLFRQADHLELKGAFVDRLHAELKTALVAAEAGVDELPVTAQFALFVISNSY